MSLGQLVASYDVEVRWIHFPLHPETPAEGIPLAELFRGAEAEREAYRRRLAGLLAAAGLAFRSPERLVATRRAQELAAWAERRPGGEGIHDALFAAYFVDGRDLSDRDTLVEVATEVGLDAGEAAAVLDQRLFSPVVDRDWAEARRLGLQGVPAWVVGGRGVVGAQPFEVLERLVLAAGARPRRG